MNVCSITEPDEVFDDERGYGNFWILRRRSRATIRGAERAVSAFNSQVANGFPRLHPLRRVAMVKGPYTYSLGFSGAVRYVVVHGHRQK